MNVASRLALLTSAALLTLAATSPASIVRADEIGAWAPTATLAVPVASLLGATDQGALPAAQPLTVRLGLQPRNKAALVAFAQAANTPGSPVYGKFLTPVLFANKYGTTAAQVNAVTTYLSQAGFTNIVVEPSHLLISADGTAGQAQTAFNTALEQVLVGGQTRYVNVSAAQVPAALGGVVSAVLGLNTVGHMVSQIALPGPTYIASYTPRQFQKIYGANLLRPARAASVAIMAEGDLTGVLQDLRTEEAAFKLPVVPVTVVPVGVASSDVSGADEWDLDTQYSSGMAGDLRMLYVYDTTSLTDSDLALEFSRWATDDVAQAGSASLGECEAFPYIDGSMTVDDMIFLEAASQGQTFFASSGDTGSFCPVGPAGVNGVPAGAPLVNYPAASPYVVGVGGTSLLTNKDGTYDTETTWITGGGGLSQFENVPSWQAAAVTVLSTTAMRGVPDIAMDADPNSGATVYVNGTPEEVGGTSLSSPLALGVWAHAISLNRHVGFAAPQFYSLYNPTGGTAGVTPSYPKGGFHDITVGNNGAYTALPGYDLTTGLGSLIANQIAADLK